MSMDEQAWQRWSGQVNRKLAALEPLVPWAQRDDQGTDVLTDVLARVIAVVRRDFEANQRETFEQINCLRSALDLPMVKRRVRAPAGRGRTW